jgi:hypothetical protein
MRKLLFAIYVLTIFDVGCTYIGLKNGYISESNPLLTGLFKSQPEITGILILLFVGCLLSLLWNYKEKARNLTLFISGILVIKIFVALYHATWIINIR